MNSKEDSFKVITLGTIGVGKTSLINKANNPDSDILDAPTLGIDFLSLSHSYNGTTYNLNFWDTAGQERFNNINKKYYADADVVLLVYDITDKSTFDDLEMFYANFNIAAVNEAVMIMVGNKTDREDRQVEPSLPKAHADVMDIKFIECSCKTGQNINELLDLIVEQLIGLSRPSIETKIRLSALTPEKRKCKC